MKFADLKVGQKVHDRWFMHWGDGVVKDVLKTRVIVSYPEGDTVYDKGHVQFLEKDER